MALQNDNFFDLQLAHEALVVYSPWGLEQSGTTEQLHFHFSLLCIGEGNGTPLQCSCLENPRDGGAWWAAIYGVAQSRTRLKRLSSSSNIRHWLIELFHFLICFEFQLTAEWLTLSSWPTSYLVVTGSASKMFTVVVVNFWCPATVLLIFKAIVFFAKLLEPPLHCNVISSSWVKCIVDVASWPCCFTTHFWAQIRKSLNLLFV